MIYWLYGLLLQLGTLIQRARWSDGDANECGGWSVSATAASSTKP